MARTSYEGSTKDPYQLDHFQEAIAANWGTYYLLQITFPDDLEYDFSIDTTDTTKSYKVDDEIEKKGRDDKPAIIQVLFDEPEPVIDPGSLQTGFSIKSLFGETPPLILWPHVEVVNDGRFTDEDQARWDASVEQLNALATAGYNTYATEQQKIIDDFLAVHPNAVITRNVTDLRGWVDEPPDGWGIKHIPYLPFPWQSDGGSNTVSNPGGYQIFSFPGYMTYIYSITYYPPFAPILVGGCWGKYPNYADQKRNRETFMISTQRLGDKTFDIFVNSITHHVNKEIEIVYSSGGGKFFAKAKRIVFCDNKDLITKTKSVSGAIPLISLAKFDRHGFVDT